MIIGFTGKRGSGKDTAAGRLVQRHGFHMLDFTHDILAPILRKEGKPVTRDNLIELAMQGRAKDGNGTWAKKMCERVIGMKASDFTISGIRFTEEVSVFRKAFRESFVLVALSCDERIRYDRCLKRGTKGENGMTFEAFMKTDERPTERAILDTMNVADYALDNGSSMKEFYGKIDDLVTLIKSRA